MKTLKTIDDLCETCGLEYYEQCECIVCPCCNEPTEYKFTVEGECKWCKNHPDNRGRL